MHFKDIFGHTLCVIWIVESYPPVISFFFMPKTMNASSDFTILPPKVPGPRSKLQALEEGGENVVTLASPKTVGVLTHPCFFLGVVWRRRKFFGREGWRFLLWCAHSNPIWWTFEVAKREKNGGHFFGWRQTLKERSLPNDLWNWLLY